MKSVSFVTVLLLCCVLFFCNSSANASVLNMSGATEPEIRKMFSYFHGARGYWIIVMYASWCNHCAQDFGKVSEFNSRFPDVGIDMISLDTNLDRLRLFLNRHGSLDTDTYVFGDIRDISLLVHVASKVLGLKFFGTIPLYAVVDANKDSIVFQTNSFDKVYRFFSGISGHAGT